MNKLFVIAFVLFSITGTQARATEEVVGDLASFCQSNLAENRTVVAVASKVTYSRNVLTLNFRGGEKFVMSPVSDIPDQLRFLEENIFNDMAIGSIVWNHESTWYAVTNVVISFTANKMSVTCATLFLKERPSV